MKSSTALPFAAGFSALLGAAPFASVAADAGTPDPRPSDAELAPIEIPAVPTTISAFDSARRKCRTTDTPFPDAPPLGVVIDGELVESGDDTRSFAALKLLEAGNVYSLEYICARPLHERTGIRIGNMAIVIHTMEGPVPLIAEVLEELAEKQAGHFERHQRYAADLTELGWPERKHEVALTLNVTARAAGWTASAEHENYPLTCAIFGGNAPRPARSKRTSEVVCPAAQRTVAQ